jgi:hypothetical protein
LCFQKKPLDFFRKVWIIETMKPVKLEMTFEHGRVNGILDGKPFTVLQEGYKTSINGPFDSDDVTFADMLSSSILDFTTKVLYAIDAAMDETDELDIWEETPEDISEDIYHFLN